MDTPARHATVVQHQNAICPHRRRNPVRNHKRRAPFHQVIQRLLNLRLCLCIQCRSRIVQNQNTRIGHNGHCKSQTLLLTARQIRAALLNRCFVFFRQRHNKIVQLRGLGRRHHLLGRGMGLTVANIIGNRPRKQNGFLRHHTDVMSQRRNFDILYIVIVQNNLPLCGFIKPHQQTHQRTLPRPRRPNHSHRSPRPHDKIEIPKHVIARICIAKRHIANRHAPAHLVERLRIFPILNNHLFIQHLKHAADHHQHLLQRGIHIGKCDQWRKKISHRHRKIDQFSNRHHTAAHLQRAKIKDQPHRNPSHNRTDGPQRRTQNGLFDAQPIQPDQTPEKIPKLPSFSRIRQDEADPL